MFYQLLITTFCVYVIWKMWFNTKKSYPPPDLSGKLPIIGHTLQLLVNSTELYESMKKVSEECQVKGGVLTADVLGLRRIYLISDPEDCLTISNTFLEKEEMYNLARPLLGNGLITADAATWKKHRKLLNPAFNQSVLNSFIGIFNNQARVLVRLFAQGIGKPFDQENFLRMNNLESICLTATGCGGEEYVDFQTQYLTIFPKILESIYQRLQKPWLHIDFIYNFSELKIEQDKAINPLLELTRKIIHTKKAEMKNYKQLSAENKPGKLKPFMDLILELANETGCFTDEQIQQETDSFIAAGYETSSTVLCFAFTLLGSYPDIQSKVYEEIIGVFGSTDNDLEKDDLSKLVYTEAVLKETLRLYPAAPIIARYANEAVKLRNYTLEANSSCILLLHGVNRHPMWGPDADQFRPERWLDAATVPDPNYFSSFGLGRRSCIGKVYAMMSMKIMLAHVIRRYRISADVTKMILKWEVVTRPITGHEITLELRK